MYRFLKHCRAADPRRPGPAGMPFRRIVAVPALFCVIAALLAIAGAQAAPPAQPIPSVISGGSQLRVMDAPAPQMRPAVRPVVALVKQPDTPRSPVVEPVPLPPVEESAAPAEAAGVPAPGYGSYAIRPIGTLGVNIEPKQGQVPREENPTRMLEQEFGATEFHREPLNYNYMWESPAFFNQPLYFEQPNLERYGYDWGLAQPWISAAQFYVKIPLLPYMMVVHPPRERVYSLGYYRPGSRAPYQINWPDVRLDASMVEAAFITGLVFLIP